MMEYSVYSDEYTNPFVCLNNSCYLTSMQIYSVWVFVVIDLTGKKGIMSNLKQYKWHIEYTFVAFCKVVLCNVPMSAYRNIGGRQRREIFHGGKVSQSIYNRQLFSGTNKFDGIYCV